MSEKIIRTAKPVQRHARFRTRRVKRTGRITRAKLLRLALSGLSWDEIAQKLGCSKYLVYQLRKEYALTNSENAGI